MTRRHSRTRGMRVAHPDAHFSYTLKPVPGDDIQTIGLHIDGQGLSYSAGGAPVPKAFTWQARDQNDAKATVRFGGGPGFGLVQQSGRLVGIPVLRQGRELSANRRDRNPGVGHPDRQGPCHLTKR